MAQSTASAVNRNPAITRKINDSLQLTFAMLIGLSIFAGVAFAHPQLIHNAAHDSRHAIAVPCH